MKTREVLTDNELKLVNLDTNGEYGMKEEARNHDGFHAK